MLWIQFAMHKKTWHGYQEWWSIKRWFTVMWRATTIPACYESSIVRLTTPTIGLCRPTPGKVIFLQQGRRYAPSALLQEDGQSGSNGKDWFTLPWPKPIFLYVWVWLYVNYVSPESVLSVPGIRPFVFKKYLECFLFETWTDFSDWFL